MLKKIQLVKQNQFFRQLNEYLKQYFVSYNRMKDYI